MELASAGLGVGLGLGLASVGLLGFNLSWVEDGFGCGWFGAGLGLAWVRVGWWLLMAWFRVGDTKLCEKTAKISNQMRWVFKIRRS